MNNTITLTFCLLASIVIHTWGGFSNKENQNIVQETFQHNVKTDMFNKTQDRTYVSNTSTGHSFQVDAGSNEYWMSSSNEYISSDDLFYDPNTDNSVNNESWMKLTIEN